LTLPESDRYFDDKLDILERNGLGASATFNIVRGEDPPYEMMGFLRLMQLQGEGNGGLGVWELMLKCARLACFFHPKGGGWGAGGLRG
jgi:hypothetical protein